MGKDAQIASGMYFGSGAAGVLCLQHSWSWQGGFWFLLAVILIALGEVYLRLAVSK